VGCNDDSPKSPGSTATANNTAVSPTETVKKNVTPTTPTNGDKKAPTGNAAKNPLGQMMQAAKLMQQMGKTMAGQAQKNGLINQVVNWRKLAPFLPDQLGEYKASSDVRGKTGGAAPMMISEVKRRYKKGNQEVRISIADASVTPILRAGFAMAKNFTEDSTEGIKKGGTVEGHPAILEWRKSGQRAKVSLLVAGRFIVHVRVNKAADLAPAMAIAKQLGLAKLAAVKPPPPAKAPAAK
jgi:hypothetical protein